MNGFTGIELETGEAMVFGPVTSSKTTSFSGGTGPSQASLSRTVGRTVGVTNQRVIIEDTQSPGQSRVIPNDQVQTVFIKRKQSGGQETTTIVKVLTASGETVKVDLPGVDARRASLLNETFPNAEISEVKGLPKWVVIAIAVVAGLAVLCCLINVAAPLILSLFAN